MHLFFKWFCYHPFTTILIRWQWDANSSPSVQTAHVRLRSIYFSPLLVLERWEGSPDWGDDLAGGFQWWQEGGCVPMLSVVQYMSLSVLRNLILHVSCLLPAAVVRLLRRMCKGYWWVGGVSVRVSLRTMQPLAAERCHCVWSGLGHNLSLF